MNKANTPVKKKVVPKSAAGHRPKPPLETPGPTPMDVIGLGVVLPRPLKPYRVVPQRHVGQ